LISSFTNKCTGSLQFKVKQLFSSACYIFSKTRSSVEANAVNMLVCYKVVGYQSTFQWQNACAIYCF